MCKFTQNANLPRLTSDYAGGLLCCGGLVEHLSQNEQDEHPFSPLSSKGNACLEISCMTNSNLANLIFRTNWSNGWTYNSCTGTYWTQELWKSATEGVWSPHLALWRRPRQILALKVCHTRSLVSASGADGGKSSRFPLPVTQVTSVHTFKSKQVEGSTEEEIDVVIEHATQTRPDREDVLCSKGTYNKLFWSNLKSFDSTKFLKCLII